MPAKPDDHTVTWDGRPGETPGDRALAASGDRAATRRGALDVGAVLEDRYRIIRFIAAGGVGEVYEAHDGVLDQLDFALQALRRVAVLRTAAADGLEGDPLVE
ncbi:MAG: hypothetical protein AAFX50_10130, partial [Acidobacteriota bacterium]